MALEQLRLIPLLLILFMTIGIHSSAVLPPPHPGAPPAFLLPLFHSPPNSTRTKSGRLLAGSPNARMRLYDDLLHHGYYTTRLLIGTPPKKFALIVDTGSTVTYVPCSTCEHCGNHQDPKFNPDLSSTYEPMKCNADCPCDSGRDQCIYERQYAEMSTSGGVLGTDLISFGNQSALEPQRAVFGCEDLETGDLYTQRADGIIGLGRGELSIVDQLVEKGAITDSFSLCYGGMEIGGGAMVLGGISPPSDMVFSSSETGPSPYYLVKLKEIHVAGKPLPLNPEVFSGKYGAILDSGTTYTYLPEAAFLSFKDAIMKELHSLKKINGSDPKYNDICFSGGGSDVLQLSKSFPTVDLVFSNGHKLLLSPENYLFKHTKVNGAYCLGIFQNKDSTTLIGGITFRNTFVMYDRGQKRFGFWKTNCSELWERLHMSGAPLLGPSPATAKNSTVEGPPTLSPTGSPQYNFSGEVQVGQITFDMTISSNYSELKHHIPELIKFIAHELDVSTSQVHLLNLSSKGNESLIRWTIVPAGYANAMNIIDRISGHHLQLPDAFGTYKIVKWNVEPSPPPRTWLQEHYLVLIMTSMVTLIIGLSASGIWFIWRQRQQTLNSYQVVASPATEQELTALNL